MVGSKHLHMLCSVAGLTSQGTAKPGSCQQAPLDQGKCWVWCLQTWCIHGWDHYFSLCSIFYFLFIYFFCPCSSFGWEHIWVKKKSDMDEWLHVLTRGHAYLLEVVSTGSIYPFSSHNYWGQSFWVLEASHFSGVWDPLVPFPSSSFALLPIFIWFPDPL
jgi:hypothetical protein